MWNIFSETLLFLVRYSLASGMYMMKDMPMIFPINIRKNFNRSLTRRVAEADGSDPHDFNVEKLLERKGALLVNQARFMNDRE